MSIHQQQPTWTSSWEEAAEPWLGRFAGPTWPTGSDWSTRSFLWQSRPTGTAAPALWKEKKKKTWVKSLYAHLGCTVEREIGTSHCINNTCIHLFIYTYSWIRLFIPCRKRISRSLTSWWLIHLKRFWCLWLLRKCRSCPGRRSDSSCHGNGDDPDFP